MLLSTNRRRRKNVSPREPNPEYDRKKDRSCEGHLSYLASLNRSHISDKRYLLVNHDCKNRFPPSSSWWCQERPVESVVGFQLTDIDNLGDRSRSCCDCVHSQGWLCNGANKWHHWCLDHVFRLIPVQDRPKCSNYVNLERRDSTAM